MSVPGIWDCSIKKMRVQLQRIYAFENLVQVSETEGVWAPLNQRPFISLSDYISWIKSFGLGTDSSLHNIKK